MQATCVQEPRTRTYRCTADVPVADQHDPYAEHDLRAQQDMARWALVVVLVSIGTLGLTGVGVLLLWWTLEATQEAVRETARANHAFSEHSKRELRAYVRICSAHEGRVVETGKPISFPFECRNYGKTPAFDFSTRSAVVVRAKDWKWAAVIESSGEAPAHVLHPDETFHVFKETDEILPPATFQAIMDDTMCVFASITATYRDAFGDIHETEEFFEFSGPQCFEKNYARNGRWGSKAT